MHMHIDSVSPLIKLRGISGDTERPLAVMESLGMSLGKGQMRALPEKTDGDGASNCMPQPMLGLSEFDAPYLWAMN